MHCTKWIKIANDNNKFSKWIKKNYGYNLIRNITEIVQQNSIWFNMVQIFKLIILDASNL